MKKLNRKTIGLLAASLLLVASVGVGSALAYFTTFTEAKGEKVIELNFSDTDMKEIINNNAKEIVLTNESDSAVYVRVKALTGEKYTISYSEDEGNDNWNDEEIGADGFVYYKHILESKGNTNKLYVDINFDVEEDFNVIVVQESTPVLYDEEGNPYANWDVTADVVNEE